MKKLLLIAIFILSFCAITVNAQVSFGVKFGIHSFELSDPSDIIFPNDEGSIKFTNAKLGFQGGIFTKIEFANVFIEPRLMLNSTKVEYTYETDGSIIDNIKEESFTNLDIPILFGFKLLLFDAVVGPVAHIHLDSTSDLIELDGYDDRFDSANYGWRIGVGFSLKGISLGLEYEGNFSKFGDHINLGNQEFSFEDSPSRLIFNVGIKLF